MSDALTNIAAHLPAMAHRQPDAAAVIRCFRAANGSLQSESWTYAQLNHESDAIAHGLEHIGITNGVHTALLVPPSLDFFALVFALFKVGAVMVCVDPGIGVRHLKQCLSEAEPTAFIGSAKAHAARRLFGWARATNRVNVVVGPRWPLIGCRYDLDAVRELGRPANQTYELTTQPDDIAAILFTSGSTGPPKGVVYTHANFDAQVRALRDAFDIQPGEVDLSTFPLFALYAPAMGMTAVIPEMDFTRPGSVDPRNVVEPVEQFKVTNLFGSPALLKRVGAADFDSASFRSIERVISAGAPVSPRVIESIRARLTDGTEVHTPYGATETIPVATIGSDEILRDTAAQTDAGKGVCVGRPVDGVDVRIIAITDNAIDAWRDELTLPPGEIGEIIVRGPQVTRAYYRRDDATRLAKIAAPQFGADAFFHRMGDLGYFDDHGRLWMCGRKSQRVVTSDGDLYTIPCEAVFNTLPGVARSALVAVSVNGHTEPVVCIERADDAVPDATLREKLVATAERYQHTRYIRTFLIYRERGGFPVDIRHNAKIGRERLAQWAARELR